MPGQWGYRNTAKGTFFGINQLVVVAVDPKDADKDGDSPADVDDGEEDPGELRSKVFFEWLWVVLPVPACQPSENGGCSVSETEENSEMTVKWFLHVGQVIPDA